MDNDVLKKIKRMNQGGRPRVLDMFAGCGGFSLGFHKAGYEIVASLESDAKAAQTHAYNFFGITQEDDPHAVARDVTAIRPRELLEELDIGKNGVGQAVDIVIAGPPCQSYARVGRAKLRQIAEDPNAFLHDQRGRLYSEVVRYVSALKPLVVVFENVPDILNQAGENVVENICGDISDLGYVCRYTTLNAAHYGVPQMRERLFLIAYNDSLLCTPSFPKPTHWLELPNGYKVARDAALQPVKRGGVHNRERSHYTPSPVSSRTLPPAVTASQAMRDLPRYTPRQKAEIKRGVRKFDKPLSYLKGRPTKYASLMRRWSGFEARSAIWDHVIRRLPRDYPIFERMNPGDQYPDAHRISLLLWKERMQEVGLTSGDADKNSPNYDYYMSEKAAIVPPYDPGKFVDKWRKMSADEPARTLTAHLGKDSYTHIHYDSEQGRTISVREAARLQSFPDGFVFLGAMNAAFRQVGNAVPPLLSNAIAVHILNDLHIAVNDAKWEHSSVVGAVKQKATDLEMRQFSTSDVLPALV